MVVLLFCVIHKLLRMCLFQGEHISDIMKSAFWNSGISAEAALREVLVSGMVNYRKKERFGASMKKSQLKVLCLAAAASLIMGGCSGSGSDSGETVAVQSVAMLAGLNTGLQNRYAGKVVSQETQEIKKDEQRTIKEVFVEEGDDVAVGQVLFTYDTDETTLNIEQGKLELEKMSNSIETTKSQIKALEKEKNNAPSSDKLSYTIEIQTLEADIRQTEYNISTKEVEIERLEKSLENSEVKAEINGVVSSISENGYDNYGNPTAYMTIMQVGDYRVEGNINEMNAWNLPVGSSVIVRSRVDENQTWSGILDSVDMEHEVQNQNNGYYYYDSGSEMTSSTKYPFYVTLDSSEGLMMGQHVYIELGDAGSEREGIWLSSYFIEQDGGNAYVWAATDKDKLEKRQVTLGQHDDMTDEYQITEGLAAEDYIAIPEEGLKEGAPVTRYDEAYYGGGSEEVYGEMGMEGEYIDEAGMEGEFIDEAGMEGMEGEYMDEVGVEGMEDGAVDEAGGEAAGPQARMEAMPEDASAEEMPEDGADATEDTEA